MKPRLVVAVCLVLTFSVSYLLSADCDTGCKDVDEFYADATKGGFKMSPADCRHCVSYGCVTIVGPLLPYCRQDTTTMQTIYYYKKAYPSCAVKPGQNWSVQEGDGALPP
jgi:hypothetical protein